MTAPPLGAGLWLTVLGPAPLEALPLTDLGVRWVGVDLQHGQYEVSDLLDLLRVTGLPVLARTASGDFAHLGRVLDTGVTGVIVPSVDSAGDAAALVRAVRLPPQGRRSTGLSRSVVVGAPEHPLLLPMVETRGALDDAGAIAATPGVDGLFVGPYDLALALGRPGPTDEQVVAAIGTVASAAREHGVLAGVFSGSRDLDPLLPPLDLVAVDTDITALRAGVGGLF